MKSIFVLMLAASIISCTQETPKIKHVVDKEKVTNLSQVKVVNELDPICDMSMTEYLKDTAIYNGKIYGFCSDFCKKEFTKNPVKYVQ